MLYLVSIAEVARSALTSCSDMLAVAGNLLWGNLELDRAYSDCMTLWVWFLACSWPCVD